MYRGANRAGWALLLLLWGCAEGAPAKMKSTDENPPAGGMGEESGSGGTGGTGGIGGSGGVGGLGGEDAGVDEDAGVVDAGPLDADVDAGDAGDAAGPSEKRKKLSIDGTQVPTALTKFPVLVRITDADLAATADSSGFDIRFEDAAGGELSFERESYDSTDGTLVAWVAMDLTGNDQDFYLYYGGGDTSEKSAPTTVWDGNYNAVWHLEDVTDVTDSTAGGHDATSSNAAMVAGVVGNAAGFNQAQSIALPGSALGGLASQVTVSAWAYGDPAVHPAQTTLFTSQGSGSERVIHAHVPWDNGNIYWDAGDGVNMCCVAGANRINKAASAAEYEGQWNHYAFTKDSTGNSMKIYLNGALWHSGTGNQVLGGAAAMSVSIGANTYGGWVDELRISKVERSADWIQTQYNSQRPAATFLTVGSEEDP